MENIFLVKGFCDNQHSSINPKCRIYFVRRWLTGACAKNKIRAAIIIVEIITMKKKNRGVKKEGNSPRIELIQKADWLTQRCVCASLGLHAQLWYSFAYYKPYTCITIYYLKWNTIRDLLQQAVRQPSDKGK